MWPSGGEADSWVIDVLDTQLARLRGVRGQIEILRARLVSIGEEMVWRSRAAGGFHRDVDDRVATLDRLLAVLRDLEGGIQSAMARLLRAKHLAG